MASLRVARVLAARGAGRNKDISRGYENGPPAWSRPEQARVGASLLAVALSGGVCVVVRVREAASLPSDPSNVPVLVPGRW